MRTGRRSERCSGGSYTSASRRSGTDRGARRNRVRVRQRWARDRAGDVALIHRRGLTVPPAALDGNVMTVLAAGSSVVRRPPTFGGPGFQRAPVATDAIVSKPPSTSNPLNTQGSPYAPSAAFASAA